VKKGTAWDYGPTSSRLGHLDAEFWLRIMLIFLFSIKLGWLPASGFVPPSERFAREPRPPPIHPAFVLGNSHCRDPDAP